jgi:hypothetical protein
MTEAEIAEYEGVAGDMLAELGYEVVTDEGRARVEEKGVAVPAV